MTEKPIIGYQSICRFDPIWLWNIFLIDKNHSYFEINIQTTYEYI